VRPSLIVLDLSMPEMDGYALARAIRALPGYAAVPMVALSGFGSEADRVKSRESGFDRHMLKPFDLADLERMLELVANPLP
jgi:CheY-like chemotaxis protein